MNIAVTGANWFKSSYSRPNGECVEAAHLAEGMVGVRDSKNPAGPALVFDGNAWDAFVSELKAGTFDR
ncbi:DUF397 domain-containing protein [Nocardia sp. NPDC005978]|uniref:DUF397 domain-containing protein n=1 Tax=Nocardia sp. NPDC005978 TaxID=3156725 RepID=UPI0033AB10B7